MQKSLEKVIELNPNHISVYSLILEENTKLYSESLEGKLELPSEEVERNMYWLVKKELEENGYKHYEISNFAKLGFESRHNMDCWSQKEYIGFGLNASSYLDSKRFSNISDIGKYMKNIENEEFKKNAIIEEIQNKEEQMKEFIMLRIKKNRWNRQQRIL